jgi:hypothetical protein
MAEGHCVHCVSVTEYHPIYYTDNFLEVSCEVSINTSCCHECQDVTDHRVKRARRDVLTILGVNWLFFFPAPYGSGKERKILGQGDVTDSLLRRPWISNAADLDTYYSLPIISTYFTDSIHCFILPTKEFMKRTHKYQWKKFSTCFGRKCPSSGVFKTSNSGHCYMCYRCR